MPYLAYLLTLLAVLGVVLALGGYLALGLPLLLVAVLLTRRTVRRREREGHEP